MTAQVAFLFPGQGSQAVGMGVDVFAASSAAKQVFESVDEALGISLSTLCFQGPEDILRETINAQPATLTHQSGHAHKIECTRNYQGSILTDAVSGCITRNKR